MTAARRWCIVALGVALVIGMPLGLRALPAHDRDINARALLAQIQAAASHPYSGYVETLGTLQLPVADHFTDVGALFGERTRMRVWWRSDADWRVDKVLVTGETDVFHDSRFTTTWDYERAEATRSRDPEIRLPRTADLVPPELARHLLSDADASELSRLPARHVAGRDALGLRLSPSVAQSSIDHADLWADSDTGVPLRIQVFARGTATAAFTTEFMSFTAATPDENVTRFTAPPGTKLSYDDVIDVADGANQFAPLAPPAMLAGLSRPNDRRLRAVGLYGTGVTRMVAIPLSDRAAMPLREQMEQTPGVQLVAEGDLLTAGPLSVLLTEFSGYGGGWLVAGTVTEQTLITAAHQLEQQARVLR